MIHRRPARGAGGSRCRRRPARSSSASSSCAISRSTFGAGAEPLPLELGDPCLQGLDEQLLRPQRGGHALDLDRHPGVLSLQRGDRCAQLGRVGWKSIGHGQDHQITAHGANKTRRSRPISSLLCPVLIPPVRAARPSSDGASRSPPTRAYRNVPSGEADGPCPGEFVVSDPRHQLFGRRFAVLRRLARRAGNVSPSFEVEHRGGGTLLIPEAASGGRVRDQAER